MVLKEKGRVIYVLSGVNFLNLIILINSIPNWIQLQPYVGVITICVMMKMREKGACFDEIVTGLCIKASSNR